MALQTESSNALAATLRVEGRHEVAAAHEAGQRWRHITRWVGLGLFLFGVLLLLWVFWMAWAHFGRFASDTYLSDKLAGMANAEVGVQVQVVLAVFGAELLRVLYLFALGFVASAIASKGINFFSASQSVIDEAVVAEAAEAEVLEAEASEVL